MMMFDRLRRMFGAGPSVTAWTESLGPTQQPPAVPAVPGGTSPARREQAEQRLRALAGELDGALDSGTGHVFDPTIEAWGAGWDIDDDRGYAGYLTVLRQRITQVQALLAAAELTRRRCERAWVLADRDVRAARARLGALDPEGDPGDDPEGDRPISPVPFPPHSQARRLG
jgi:hypothetical protein